MQYKDFDKQLIQLHKEKTALWKQKQQLGWEPLVPPIQKGWKRSFVLREDVARSKQAAFFENILKKINTYSWSHRKDFKVRKRKGGKKNYIVKPQSLLSPYEGQFKEMKFTDAEKQFFYEVWQMDKQKRLTKRYVFREPWRFLLRVQPNMVTRIRKTDPMLERRLHEIKSYLERNNYEKRLYRILDGVVRYRDIEIKENVNILKNKSLQQVLDELHEE